MIFIQGPPGTGKTYTASHVILDLLKAGKRIGVSSNSHKAIVNLLGAVEKEAKSCGFTFSGVKKSDPLDASQCVNGECIKDIKDKEGIIAADAQPVRRNRTMWARRMRRSDALCPPALKAPRQATRHCDREGSQSEIRSLGTASDC